MNNVVVADDSITYDHLVEISTRIAAILKSRKETIAITESACGGLISSALLSIPGASSFYKGANVAYSRDSQRAYFPSDLMDKVKNGKVKYGAEEFMLLRASDVARKLNATYGLSETGQTGPVFLRVKPRGPFDNVTGSSDGEGGIKRMKNGRKGQARAVVAFSTSSSSSNYMIKVAKRLTTTFSNRQKNMMYFAYNALEMVEKHLLLLQNNRAVQGNYHLKSAVEVVELLKRNEVTPLELIDLVEKRIDETEYLIHATPITCFERARANARKLKIPENPPPGYLYGLPVLIKDLNGVEGVRFTHGSLIFKDRIAKRTGPVAMQIEAMGGIVCGKTNVPEFGAGSNSFNEIFPTTKSPYDTRTTAGGSSGGAAAAVSACQAWLCNGSDLGGSLRTPASFCGIVGFRTSPGTVVTKGPSGKRANFLHSIQGPMARTVKDLSLFLDTMTMNPTTGTLPDKTIGWETYADYPKRPAKFYSWQHLVEETLSTPTWGKPLKIAYSTLNCNIAKEYNAVCKDAANRFFQSIQNINGSKFNHVKEPFDLEMAEDHFYLLRAHLFGGSFGKFPKDWYDLLKPEIKWNSNCYQLSSFPTSKSGLTNVFNRNEEFHIQVNQFFNEYDVLITPASLDGPFNADVRYPLRKYGDVDEHFEFSNYLSWMMPACKISTTSCPAIVVPVGKLKDGRPVCVQMVCKLNNDMKLLQMAAHLERVIGFDARMPNPVKGTYDLIAEGPKTTAEAALHCDIALNNFLEKYDTTTEGSKSARL